MKVSILGHGVVGKGVWEMLKSNPGYEIRNVLVKKGEKSADFMTESFDAVLADDSDLVIECMGGIDPAFEFTSKCLEAGKSIISSNKALVAAHGIDLMNIALRKGKAFLFSAACGGAIPILQNLCLARRTDEILWAGGILNGTTNYILDSMDRRNMSFEDALAEAKALGYAEFDPTADISGLDTLRKIMLISMVAYDVLPNSDYNIEGIQNVTALDFEVAKELGCTIRLVGKCGLAGSGRLYAYVQPVLCDKDSAYSGIRSNINLARYEGKNSGLMSFMGQGAGRYPTASAILRDVTSVSDGQRQMLTEKCLVGFPYNNSKECERNFFIRLDSQSFAAQIGGIPVKRVICEKNGYVFAVTEAVTVKAMHDLAAELRRHGAKLFFAEKKED
ncbi:MAG: homoserine dehydrogenase [Spirochaetales bacterium]|nr:homoserine dehydrogenase [Spirochaetales bacterium]